jgi:benzoyl-CoA reductase subunit BamB
VRGTGDVSVAQPLEYLELCNEVLEYIKWREDNPIPGVIPILSVLGSPQEMAIHDEKWHTENFSWGNARVRRRDFWTEEIAEEWRETMEGMQTRLISCYNCPMKCGATITPPGKPTYMMKCFSKLTYTMAAFSNLDFGLTIAQRATEYGLDGYSTPQVMAFALELYENGILTDDDLPGLPENNEDKFYYLIDKIVNREGIGDVLANGTYWAAREIGNGAEEYAHNNIKKHEQLPLKLGMLNPIYFLMYCTGEKINITQIEGQFPQGPFPKREHREKFVKDWFQVPDEKFKQYFLDWEPRGENSMPYYPTVPMVCDIVDWMEMMHYIDDALGMCAGVSSFHLKPPYHIHNFPKFIQAGAGIEMDEAKLTKSAKRYRTLVRANNIRRGLRRKDEQPPDTHWKKRFPELEAELLDSYYEMKGWNKDGIPTLASLYDLELGYVGEDFLERGILNEGDEDAPAEEIAAQK